MQPFAVCLGRAVPLEHPCSLKLMLDGHLVAGRFADKGNTWEASVSGCRVSTTEVRDFKFGTMESTGMFSRHFLKTGRSITFFR